MAVAKRQRRGKPIKIEQRKVRGPELGPQVKQTALLASPIYLGRKIVFLMVSISLLAITMKFCMAYYTWRMNFLLVFLPSENSVEKMIG